MHTFLLLSISACSEQTHQPSVGKVDTASDTGGALPPTEGEVNGVQVLCAERGCTLAMSLSMTDAEGQPVRENLSTDDFSLLYMAMSDEAEALQLQVERATVTALHVEVVTATTVAAPLLLDQSGSMSSNDPDDLRLVASEALIDNLFQAEAGHQLALMSFPREEELGNLDDTDIWHDFTTDAALLKEILPQLADETDSGTPLYDSIYEVLMYQDKILEGQDVARALVVLTDGEDSESSHDEVEVIRLAQELQTPLYLAALGNNVAVGVLAQMATETGGFFVSANNPDDLTNAFVGLSQALYGSITLDAEMSFSSESDPLQEGWYRITGEVDWKGEFSMPVDVTVYITE